ncbi:MAG: hypothetical protein KIS81_01435 [Maricaulaceae bacterium]|nr:hypothetical protein [Maricaulaceae bacterium]
MNPDYPNAVRRLAAAMFSIAVHAVCASQAHAQTPPHGLSEGSGLLHPSVLESTRFHNQRFAEAVDTFLVWIETVYADCDLYAGSDGVRDLTVFLNQAREELATPDRDTSPFFSSSDEELAQDIDSLERLVLALPDGPPRPCPPENVAYNLRAFGHHGVINGLGIANAGFGGRHDASVTGGGISLTAHDAPGSPTFTIHFLTGDASSPAGNTGIDPQGHTFVQFNGDTQVIPPGLNVTGARMTSEYREIGGSVRIGPEWDARIRERAGGAPKRHAIFSIRAGVTDIRHTERLQIDYGDINFGIDEQREVETLRFHVRPEAEMRQEISDSWSAWISVWVAANFDVVEGEGSYHTFQLNNFDETVRLERSRTAFTGAFGAEGGLRIRVADNTTIDIGGSVRRIPVWALNPRESVDARLGYDMHWAYGVTAGVAMAW